MSTYPQFGSSNFAHCAKGLIALHRMIKQGTDDSPEGEALRDTLDAPLNALSQTERERARWLSEDFYSISEPGSDATLKEMTAEAQQQLMEVYEARENGEWERALSLLRQWKEYLPPAQLNALRGSIWFAAGNSDIAAEFYGCALEYDPKNANYLVKYLQALTESDPTTARKLAGKVMADNEQ